ncbi:MAG: oxygenase MpaB family protein, partial [Candidatus Binatia bacterium]
MRARLASRELSIGRDGRALAAAILRPPLLPGLRQLAGTSRLFTVGLLPPSLRRRYGFEWSPAREAALNAVAAASRRGLPLVPEVLRHVARARRARG